MPSSKDRSVGRLSVRKGERAGYIIALDTRKGEGQEENEEEEEEKGQWQKRNVLPYAVVLSCASAGCRSKGPGRRPPARSLIDRSVIDHASQHNTYCTYIKESSASRDA
jgi:hypothetical protein